MTTAVIVRLGRSSAMGEERRTQTWQELFSAIGVDAKVVQLLGGPRLGGLRLGRAASVARGRSVPEVLAWSSARASVEIASASPSVVVHLTTRAWEAQLAPPGARRVLDFVDQLSVSYAQRREIAGPRGIGFSALALAHRRVERAPTKDVVRIAAGVLDAEALQAEWMPVFAPDLEPVSAGAADHDVGFVGNLSYPPNVAAVALLGRLWPAIDGGRSRTALIAGRNPSPTVERVARLHGWTLLADFADLRTVLGRARLAVAPVRHTAGIQMKALDAAAAGVAQVVTPDVARGLDPDFPVVVAGSDEAFVAAVQRLLDDDAIRARLASSSHEHILRRYRPAAWVDFARSLTNRED